MARYYKFKSKTTVITISIPYDILDEIEEFAYVFDITSRSYAISYLLNQGLIRVKEKNYDRYSEKLPEKYPKIEEQPEK